MTLSAGTKLGSYEILAPIGAGGMGEVYRAKDSRLARDVAIKVLPEEFFESEERRTRFEREARLLAALNHPNVAGIHSFEEIPGPPSRHILVMELLEGETLRSALAGAKVSTKKALEWARQIAQGLAAAHEKGIVHRDLKPENVFLTKDGRIKILDFGLAKLTQAEESPNATNLPTAARGTEPGMVMGTLGYMSPEQVKGQPADARSDIFSFGAILFEMLTGQRAFHRETAAETISAILKEDPPDLSVTNQNVPPGLERLVSHCLEKNPEQRFHSAHDLAFDLESVSGSSGVRASASPAYRTSARIPSKPVLVAVAAALAAGLLAGRLIWKSSPYSPPSFHRLTYRRGHISSARFAPDGQTVVYAAAWDGAQKADLYSARMENPEAIRLPLPDKGIESISRAGDMLILSLLRFSAGYARTGILSQAPLSGSGPRDLIEDVGSANWAPDGKALAVVRAPQWRYRLEYPLGKVLYETTGWISFPRVSPKGDAVAFFDHPVFGDDRGSVAIIGLDGKKKTLSTGWESQQGMSWSASGKEIWFTATPAGMSRALFAVTPSGRQRPIARTPAGLILQDISRDGRVLFIQSNARLGFLGVVPGEKERDLTGLEWSFQPLLSEDGKTAFFSEQGEAGGPGYSVYLRRLDGSAPVRLGEGIALALSPDGKWVLTCLFNTTPPSIALLPTGAGEPRVFPKDAIDHSNGFFGAFLPDGKRILFSGNEPGRPPRAFLQDLQGGAARAVTAEGVSPKLLSPDGRTLVVLTAEPQLATVPLEGGAVRPLTGLEPTDEPLRFTPDGHALFVGERRRQFPARIFRYDLSTGRRDLWKEMSPSDASGLTMFEAAGITADGKTFLFTFGQSMDELYVAEGMK
ncbi:MAG: protein kinase [Acidobacteriota bacterium]